MERSIKALAEDIKEEVLLNFDKKIKLIEDACASILLETSVPSNTLLQDLENHKTQCAMIREIYNKVRTTQASLEAVEKTTQTQEEKINSLIESSSQGIKPIISQRKSIQLKTIEPPIGQIELNMLQIKNFGRKLKHKCSKKKPKMDWNKFGENEWQIVEKAMIEQKLPPVRNEDLFLFGNLMSSIQTG